MPLWCCFSSRLPLLRKYLSSVWFVCTFFIWVCKKKSHVQDSGKLEKKVTNPHPQLRASTWPLLFASLFVHLCCLRLGPGLFRKKLEIKMAWSSLPDQFTDLVSPYLVFEIWITEQWGPPVRRGWWLVLYTSKSMVFGQLLRWPYLKHDWSMSGKQH